MADEDLMITGDDITAVAERPKSLSKDLTGTESIGVDDVRLPRLTIAQGLSGQLIEGDSSYIPGLSMFDLFNDLTGDNYKKGPITFVPLRRDVRRIEFIPRSEGGGVKDLNVPKNDDRMKWTWSTPDLKASGEKADVPPKATEFIEFIILMLLKGKAPEPIVLSIKQTNKFNTRASDRLTTFIKLRNAAIYSGLYKVSSRSEKNDSGTFGTYMIENAGFIPVDNPRGAALLDYAKKFASSLEGKNVVIDREPGSDDDSFDTGAMENEKRTGSEM